MPVSHSKSPSSCNVNRPTKYSRLFFLPSITILDLVCFYLLVYHIYTCILERTSTIHVIHGDANMSSMVTPCSASRSRELRSSMHAWGFCCNSHKSEVWQSTIGV